MVQRTLTLLLLVLRFSPIIALPYPETTSLPLHTWAPTPFSKYSTFQTPISTLNNDNAFTTPSVTTTRPANQVQYNASITTPTALSDPKSKNDIQKQLGWSPSDIGTVVFGCISAVLGLLTLWLTFWLGRARFKIIGNEDIQLRNLPGRHRGDWRANNTMSRQLIGDPKSQAQGVFLWVCLVQVGSKYRQQQREGHM